FVGGIVIDGGGAPHITFANTVAKTLRYGTRSGGAWSIETVPGPVNPFTSGLALDSGGEPHIAYYDGSVGTSYVHRSGGGWAIETVDNAGALSPLSLHLGPSRNPCIAYQGTSVKYASKSGSSWSSEYVGYHGAGWNFVNGAVSLCLSNGAPRVVYYRANEDLGKYAVKLGGVWTIEDFDLGGGSP